jgi:hypothetical protein
MVHDHAGMNIMAKGYDPAGAMFVIKYEGVSSKPYEDFVKRYQVYKDTIEHADQEHGMLTPSGGMQMGMSGMDMGGMSMGGGEGGH